MSINFPTSLDDLTNPQGTDTLNSPDHATQHADTNDAIEALEAKVGITNSEDTNSLDYKMANHTHNYAPALGDDDNYVTDAEKTALHTHSNKATLDNITAAYTSTDASKLAGIAEGAEVNVQPDWNQTTDTADDYIKNKPTIPTLPVKASGAEVDTGEDDAKFVTAKAIEDSSYIKSTNVLALDNTTEFTPDADYEPATKKYVDDNAGGAFVSQFRTSISTSANLSGKINKIAFDTEHFDTGNEYDNATNYRFTPSVAGYYFLTAATKVGGVTDGTAVHIYIFKNGSYHRGVSGVTNGTTCTLQISDIVYSDGDDYFEIFIESDDTSISLQGGSNGLTYFSGFRVA